MVGVAVFSLTVLLVGSALGVMLARRARRSHPAMDIDSALRDAPLLLVISIACLLVVVLPLTAQLSDRVAQILPLRLQRDAALATWGTIGFLFAVLSGFSLYALRRSSDPRRRRLTLAVVSLHTALLVASVHWNAPLAAALTEERRTQRGFWFQTNPSSCAAATVANIAQGFGISITEREAAALLGTTKLGTSPGQMRYALDQLGIATETLNERYASIDGVPPPAILFFDHPATGPESHAIALLRVDGDVVQVFDPIEGLVSFTASHAAALWHGNGIRCFAMTPPEPAPQR